jgi:hypothetical protein
LLRAPTSGFTLRVLSLSKRVGVCWRVGAVLLLSQQPCLNRVSKGLGRKDQGVLKAKRRCLQYSFFCQSVSVAQDAADEGDKGGSPTCSSRVSLVSVKSRCVSVCTQEIIGDLVSRLNLHFNHRKQVSYAALVLGAPFLWGILVESWDCCQPPHDAVSWLALHTRPFFIALSTHSVHAFPMFSPGPAAPATT